MPTGGRGTGRTASLIVGLAVRALPRGRSRERYRQEFLADLHHLGGRRGLRYAVGVLVQVLPLRFALERTSRSAWEAVAGVRVRKPLRCRVNLRHHWVIESTEDGGNRFRTCRRCGKDDGDRSHHWAASGGMG